MMNIKQDFAQARKAHKHMWILILLAALLLAGCNTAVKEGPLEELSELSNIKVTSYTLINADTNLSMEGT
jgi:predicted component of type VI protein secretion system